jgi:D-alanyl-D-alanine carboxypeptidase
MRNTEGRSMNRKLFRHFFSVTLMLLYFTFVSSCAGNDPSALVFEACQYTLNPGSTTELICTALFLEGEPGGKAIKNFSAEPDVEVSDSGIKVLSVKPESSRDGIRTTITIRMSDEILSGSLSDIKIDWGGYSAITAVKAKKDPAANISTDGVITDPAAYDALINKQRRLPADYIPSDLVRVNVPTILAFEEVNHLRRAASDALTAMFSAAEAEEGYELLARSGYRSYKTQVMLYESNVREHGEEYASRISARPGTSEHQSGLVMDISSPVVNYQLTQDFGETGEGRWVARNAHRFGFIIRYLDGREDITGYTYEPWHLRYVGRELAAEIYAGGLTLEEYLGD